MRACVKARALLSGLASVLIVICRVGQNSIYTPYMTVFLEISLPKVPYINRIYMVLANPNDMAYAM